MPCWMNVAPISDSTMSHRIELLSAPPCSASPWPSRMYGPTCSFSRAILLSDSSETASRAFWPAGLVHVGMHLVQRFRGDQFEHRVSQEFEAFVIGHAGVLMREGTVGECLHEQIRAESGAQRFKKLVGRRRLLWGFITHDCCMVLHAMVMCCVVLCCLRCDGVRNGALMQRPRHPSMAGPSFNRYRRTHLV